MNGTTPKAVGISILVLLAGCSGIGATGEQATEETEPIAELNSLNVEPVGDIHCGFEYNISKQEGVMIQIKQGVGSKFAGNGQYYKELETELDNWIVIPGGGKPIQINAYETPTNGTGKSLQLWNGTVTNNCEVAEG